MAPQVPWRELRTLATRVVCYLPSNFELVPVTTIERAVFVVRYRGIVAVLSQQLHAVDMLLRLSAQVGSRIAMITADSKFAITVDAFAAATQDSRGRQLRLAVERGHTMRIEGIRHPLLPNGVTSDLLLAADERKLFLTGPNMAGKSTLLRAMGIAAYCAHLGMALAACAAMVPLYDRLMVSITVRDNLQRGESAYPAEARRVRAVVKAMVSGDAIVVSVDEAFRRTNIKDATQATSLLVDGLATASHGTLVIASHIADVAASRTDHVGVACWRMDVDVAGDTPVFTHRVSRGVSDVHHGMLLLNAVESGRCCAEWQRVHRPSGRASASPSPDDPLPAFHAPMVHSVRRLSAPGSFSVYSPRARRSRRPEPRGATKNNRSVSELAARCVLPPGDAPANGAKPL